MLRELADEADVAAVVVRTGAVIHAPGTLDLGRTTRPRLARGPATSAPRAVPDVCHRRLRGAVLSHEGSPRLVLGARRTHRPRQPAAAVQSPSHRGSRRRVDVEAPARSHVDGDVRRRFDDDHRPAEAGAVMGARGLLRRGLDRLPHPLGRARHVDVRDAEVRDGVDDRVLDRRRRADRARLADALRAERVARAVGLGVRRLEAAAARPPTGSRSPSRFDVIGLPSSSYCTHSYSACAAPWAMPPCCWPRDEQRVEDAAAVVDGDVAQHRRRRRSRCRPRRPRRGRRTGTSSRCRRSRARGAAAPARCRRAAWRRRCDAAASSAHDTALRRHAGDLQAAVADDDVVGVGLEQVGGDLLGPVEHLVRTRRGSRCRRSAATASPSCRRRAARVRCRS